MNRKILLLVIISFLMLFSTACEFKDVMGGIEDNGIYEEGKWDYTTWDESTWQ